MDIRTIRLTGLDSLTAPLFAVPVLESSEGGVTLPELPGGLGAAVKRAKGRARASAGSRFVADVEGGGSHRMVFVGLGCAPDAITEEALRRYAAHAVRTAEDERVSELAVLLPDGAPAGLEPHARGRAAAEGAVLAAWRFRELKTGAGEDEPPTEVSSAVFVTADAEDAVQEGAHEGQILAEAENVARVLQSRPGNIATPTHLGEEARRMASAYGMEVDVLGPERLKEERMAALLAVSQGSAQEPRLIVLRHRGGAPDQKPVILVGKGLTFDAGGISIKPASGMEEMKFDMSGGAAVLAAMTAIARLGVPRNVVGIVPSSENLLSGRAMKPGDIVKTRNGKTVEIVNTDAEGRLILCDALDYAVEMEPEAIVDCATLTGAVVVGLGHHAIGLLGTDDDVVQEVRDAGERCGERCWPLPLWKEYRTQLDSVSADFMNVGGRPAGSITAAVFLSEFVGDVPWAHLDIAGTAYGDGGKIPYRRKGGYGVPTRLLVEWVRSRAR